MTDSSGASWSGAVLVAVRSIKGDGDVAAPVSRPHNRFVVGVKYLG